MSSNWWHPALFVFSFVFAVRSSHVKISTVLKRPSRNNDRVIQQVYMRNCPVKLQLSSGENLLPEGSVWLVQWISWVQFHKETAGLALTRAEVPLNKRVIWILWRLIAELSRLKNSNAVRDGIPLKRKTLLDPWLNRVWISWKGSSIWRSVKKNGFRMELLLRTTLFGRSINGIANFEEPSREILNCVSATGPKRKSVSCNGRAS